MKKGPNLCLLCLKNDLVSSGLRPDANFHKVYLQTDAASQKWNIWKCIYTRIFRCTICVSLQHQIGTLYVCVLSATWRKYLMYWKREINYGKLQLVCSTFLISVHYYTGCLFSF